MPSSGAASGRSIQRMLQTSAIAVPVTVTTKSMPNIWRTWSRDTCPSVSTIAARICAIVSTPPSCVASRTMPHVGQPKPGSALAATWTMITITQVTSANCARLKANLTAEARRSTSATAVPSVIARNACVPVAKISASVNGTSVSENECELRRNSSSTGQRSVTTMASASTHHAISGV